MIYQWVLTSAPFCFFLFLFFILTQGLINWTRLVLNLQSSCFIPLNSWESRPVPWPEGLARFSSFDTGWISAQKITSAPMCSNVTLCRVSASGACQHKVAAGLPTRKEEKALCCVQFHFSTNKKYWWMCRQKETSVHCCSEWKLVKPLWRSVLKFLQNQKWICYMT